MDCPSSQFLSGNSNHRCFLEVPPTVWIFATMSVISKYSKTVWGCTGLTSFQIFTNKSMVMLLLYVWQETLSFICSYIMLAFIFLPYMYALLTLMQSILSPNFINRFLIGICICFTHVHISVVLHWKPKYGLIKWHAYANKINEIKLLAVKILLCIRVNTIL